MRFKFYQLIDTKEFSQSFKISLEQDNDGNLVGKQNLPFEINNTDYISIKIEQIKIMNKYTGQIIFYKKRQKEEFIIIELDNDLEIMYNKIFDKIKLTPREKLLSLLTHYKPWSLLGSLLDIDKSKNKLLEMLEREEEIKMEILN